MGIVDSHHRKEAEEEIKQTIGRMSKLRNELQTNKPLIELTSNASDVKLWNQFLNNYQNINKCDALWFGAQWLYVESYLYRRIREAFELTQYITSFDPFQESKEEALKTSIEAVEVLSSYLDSLKSMNEFSVEDQFNKFVEVSHSSLFNLFNLILKSVYYLLIQLSLWGNKCDLSISSGNQNSQSTNPFDDIIKMSDKIVANDLKKLWNYVKNLSLSSSSIQLIVVLDNAGFELFSDLCLVEFLHISGLLKGDSIVKFYVKSIPWFVSDTMTKDFDWLLKYLSNSRNTHSSHIKHLSNKWINYLKTGKWVIVEDDFWTLPHDFSQMKTVSPNLYESLSESHLIIFKGDLNYRKLVGDLKWDFDVPLITSLRGFLPTTFCTLRTIKCDVVVGIDNKEMLEKIKTFPKDWMESGDYAVIQMAFK
jgi:uncharacterized protein with ATP-grasp and redox domains